MLRHPIVYSELLFVTPTIARGVSAGSHLHSRQGAHRQAGVDVACFAPLQGLKPGTAIRRQTWKY